MSDLTPLLCVILTASTVYKPVAEEIKCYRQFDDLRGSFSATDCSAKYGLTVYTPNADYRFRIWTRGVPANCSQTEVHVNVYVLEIHSADRRGLYCHLDYLYVTIHDIMIGGRICGENKWVNQTVIVKRGVPIDVYFKSDWRGLGKGFVVYYSVECTDVFVSQSEWSACSATCGWGTRTRTLTETQHCDAGPCQD